MLNLNKNFIYIILTESLNFYIMFNTDQIMKVTFEICSKLKNEECCIVYCCHALKKNHSNFWNFCFC
jgi:predicted permease